jgi:hypothetical protein
MIKIHECRVDEILDSDWIDFYLFLVFAQVLHTNLERETHGISLLIDFSYIASVFWYNVEDN